MPTRDGHPCKAGNSDAQEQSALLGIMTHPAITMTRRIRARVPLLVLAGMTTVLVGACSDATDTATDKPSPTTSTSEAPGVGGLDFASGSQVDLGDGWIVAPCESGPPLFCARHEGEAGTQSVIELLSVPTSSYPAVKRALDEGGTPAEALAAQVAEYHTTFQEDRPAGCGTDYLVDPIGPDDVTVAGHDGVMYGFDGHQDGRHVERNIHFATIRDDTLYIIVATAVEDGTCMDDGELAEFSIAELTDLQPRVAQMIAASTLP